MKHARVLSRLVVVSFIVAGFGGGSALAIYINPDATIANGTHPAVGKVGKNGGSFNCTGSILENRLSLATPNGFVVTAGHCSFPFQETAYGNTDGKFQINGGGATLTSDAIRRYPDWVQDGDLTNGDVSFQRYFNAPAAFTGVTALSLARTTSLAANDTPTIVGFGTGNASAYGTKRQSDFTIAGNAAGLATWNTVAAGPKTCGGDSGGPFLRGGRIAAIHTGATNTTDGFLPCDGTQAGIGRANTVDNTNNLQTQAKVNWLDSYTQPAIFWDRLTLNGAVVDNFEPPGAPNPGEYQRGGNGLPRNWSMANDGSATHPTFGAIGANGNWRYFNAIGRMNDNTTAELYTEGNSGLGEIQLVGGGPSLVKRDLQVNGGGNIQITVDQRWNSLQLLDDLGVRMPDGTFVWNGLATSAVANIDQWFTRSMNLDLTAFPGAQTISVYLLNVPEPATLLLVGVGVAWRLRRR